MIHTSATVRRGVERALQMASSKLMDEEARISFAAKCFGRASSTAAVTGTLFEIPRPKYPLRLVAMVAFLWTLHLCGCQLRPNAPRITREQLVLPPKPQVISPYAPELETEEVLWGGQLPVTVYRFSERQLERMARSKLDMNRFIAYIEKRWSLERLEAFCVSSNLWPRGYQNLVAINCPIDAEIHRDKKHRFDRIRVYVSEDDGQGAYVEGAGWNWHRWQYSLNVNRKRDHWWIIEVLPNDFMDSPEYADP